MKTRNFTLIEILAVFFIIAIVIGISLASLMNAKDQARFGRWLAYSANMKAEPTLVVYYNFQDTNLLKLKNQAFCTSIPTYDQPKVDAAVNSAKWVKGRWKNKGALWLNGVNSYAVIPSSNMIKSLPKEFSVEAWFYPVTLSRGVLLNSTAVVVNPNTITIPDAPGNSPGKDSPPGGIDDKMQPVTVNSLIIEINRSRVAISYLTDLNFSSHGSGVDSSEGYNWGTLVTYADLESKAYNFDCNFEAGKWYHIIVTYSYSDQRVRLYLNGVLYGEYVETRPVIYLFGQSYIGGSANLGNSFDGIIDEFGIYNRALTAYDAKAHYAMGAPR